MGIRKIREVKASARRADSFQGAENGFIRKGGVSPKRDNELGVACFSLGEEGGELVEADFFGAEKGGAVFGEGEGENGFGVGQGGSDAGGGFGEIDGELLFHEGGGDHEDDEEDKDEVEKWGDVEFGQSEA